MIVENCRVSFCRWLAGEEAPLVGWRANAAVTTPVEGVGRVGLRGRLEDWGAWW